MKRVSENHESGKHKLINSVKKPGRFIFEAGFPLFAIFLDQLEGRKSLRTFFLQPKS